jgi:two-component system, cell cycle sensor histidine kinase and response regulator CckA
MINTPVDSRPGRVVLLSGDSALHDLLGATGAITELHVSASVPDLEKLLATFQIDCVLVSRLPEQPCLIDFLGRLRSVLGRRRIIVLDSSDDSEHVVACLQAGADDFISLRNTSRLPGLLARACTLRNTVRPWRTMDPRFKTLADSAPALIWISDDHGHLIHFNRPWLEFTGSSLEEQINDGWIESILSEDRPHFLHEFNECLARRSAFRIDFRLLRNDEIYRWVTCQGIPHYDEEGVFTGYIGSCMDVSDQHEAETLLAYRAITQAALAAFGRFALSSHGIHEIKKEATRLICDTLRLDFSEVLLFAGPDSDTLLPAFSSGLPAHFTYQAMTAAEARVSGDHQLRLEDDAGIFPGRENHAALKVRSALAAAINADNQVVGFLTGLSTDGRTFGREAFDFIQALATIISTVHQRNRAELALQESETKLLQSQKMEAVGQLAGGVAHDFNNLLTAVRCYADMLHEDLAEVAPHLKSKTGEILKATARASSLTRQLLAFSRKQVLQPEVLNMNAVIADLRDLVRSLLSESISFHTHFAEDEPGFEADRNQIDQVVLNLCLNARDAMQQGGLLSLRVDTLRIEGANPHNLPPGDYVQLSVSDTGVGMDAEVQSRLFQPFFTTKPVGRGTGLGLATCAVIVKNCNGTLTFKSQLGAGTTFDLFLPRIEPPRVNYFAEEEAASVTGKESILVVEDDDAIRQIAFAILDSLGYRVTVVPGSTEALGLYRSDPNRTFDLLLSDVIMPEMDGLQLAQHLHQNHQPGLRVMFMSGYLGNTETVQAVADYNLPFLEKPFTLDSLARKVRETLDSPPVSLPPGD